MSKILMSRIAVRCLLPRLRPNRAGFTDEHTQVCPVPPRYILRPDTQIYDDTTPDRYTAEKQKRILFGCFINNRPSRIKYGEIMSLQHRSRDDLCILLELFTKQVQTLSEDLVRLLQERHELQEQIAMRKIAVEQLQRFQSPDGSSCSEELLSLQSPGGDKQLPIFQSPGVDEQRELTYAAPCADVMNVYAQPEPQSDYMTVQNRNAPDDDAVS